MCILLGLLYQNIITMHGPMYIKNPPNSLKNSGCCVQFRYKHIENVRDIPLGEYKIATGHHGCEDVRTRCTYCAT
jgi:hypothetical protein